MLKARHQALLLAVAFKVSQVDGQKVRKSTGALLHCNRFLQSLDHQLQFGKQIKF